MNDWHRLDATLAELCRLIPELTAEVRMLRESLPGEVVELRPRPRKHASMDLRADLPTPTKASIERLRRLARERGIGGE